MAWARVRGIDIHYQLAGRGPRVLYLGGTGGDLRARPSIFDSPLAQGFTLLAFDQRNLGRSGKPPEPCTMADYAADAAELLAAVGWPSARVAGYSFGGMVAQELALAFPEKVERLALLSCAAGGAGGASYPLHELWELPLEERARRLVELADAGREPSWQAAHPEEMEAMGAEARAQMELAAAQDGGEAGVRRQLAARRGHDTWQRLPGLELAVLVCGGLRDQVAPPRAVEALAGRIPGARLAWFQGGHQFFRQDPAAWPAICGFLRED
jgi:3-oxoadipate enol-lactonase